MHTVLALLCWRRFGHSQSNLVCNASLYVCGKRGSISHNAGLRYGRCLLCFCLGLCISSDVLLTLCFVFLSVGSIITPNYLDNSTSNVGPWCSCAASGNLRDQCSHFLSHFHDNTCLSE